MESLIFPWIPLLLVLFITALLVVRASIKPSKLPPGPTPLPIIGNLHMLSKLPHRDLQTLALKYGPIMTLNLGSLPTIVISSPHMAKQILKTHDHIFASRPIMGDNNHILSPQKVAFAPYGPYWKFMRKVLVWELFSPKRTKSFETLRAQEALAMIHSILKTAVTNAAAGPNPFVVDVTREVAFFTNNIICRMSFGKKCNEAELGGNLFKEILDEVLALSGGFNYRDYIPLLGRLDLQGLKQRQTELTEIFHVFLKRIVDEHLQRRRSDGNLECEDFVDVLLSLSEDVSMEIKITPEHIKNVIFDLLIAGTDTSGATLEWGMSELLRNPYALKRVQEELDSVVGQGRKVEESDLPHLPYLQSVVKETLRLYPSAPLLLPHESMEQSTIGGYQIPAKTGILVNAWAIGRDPTIWEEANEFKPERFLGSQIDVKGQDFELIPFGSGRRGCPGIRLALSMIQLGLAQLLHCFNWYLPKGVTPETLDFSEIFGITMPRADHLLAIPIPRLPLNLYDPNY